MAKKTPSADSADPDKLVRHAPGSYRTADDRFEVREAGIGWYLVDSTQTNEFGQELMHGPYDTLKDVRAAIPAARSSKVTPIRSPKAAAAKKGRRSTTGKPQPAPPPPPTWIDRLPDDEARRVRGRIRALEADGVPDAEQLVRRDHEGLGPAVAEALIQRGIDAIVAELPESDRTVARAVAAHVAELLTARRAHQDLPGWTLVEVRAQGEDPPHRRIRIRETSD